MTMAESDRHLKAEVADLAAFIERLAGDLALGEEPAAIIAVLEEAARDE